MNNMYSHSAVTVWCVVLFYFISTSFTSATSEDIIGDNNNVKHTTESESHHSDNFSAGKLNTVQIDIGPSNSYTDPAIVFSIESLDDENQSQRQLEEKDEAQMQQDREKLENLLNADLSSDLVSQQGGRKNGTSSSSWGLKSSDPEFTKMVSIIAFFAIIFIGIFAWLLQKSCNRVKSLNSDGSSFPRSRASLPLSPQFNFMGVQVIRRFNNSQNQVPTPIKPDDLPPKYEDLFPAAVHSEVLAVIPETVGGIPTNTTYNQSEKSENK